MLKSKSTRSVPTAAAGSKKKSIWRRMVKDYQLYLLVLPAIIWYIVFAYAPMYGLQIAFKDYSGAIGILESPWVGLKHFKSFFRSYYAWSLIKNTIVLSLYSMLAGFPIPIILSLMLNELKSPGYKKFAQTVLYAPHFISIVVLVGMLNLFFSPKGPIDTLRISIGLESVNYLTSATAFRHLYVVRRVAGRRLGLHYLSCVPIQRRPGASRSSHDRRRLPAPADLAHQHSLYPSHSYHSFNHERRIPLKRRL